MSERQIHWAVAIPFMVCYVTAIVLMAVYNPHPERPWRLVFSWTHRISGLALCVLPLWVIVRHWYDVAIHLANIREVWRWTLADLKWLLLTGPATFSKSVILPEQGKFNAGEKLNFMVLTVTVPLYRIVHGPDDLVAPVRIPRVGAASDDGGTGHPGAVRTPLYGAGQSRHEEGTQRHDYGIR